MIYMIYNYVVLDPRYIYFKHSVGLVAYILGFGIPVMLKKETRLTKAETSWK